MGKSYLDARSSHELYKSLGRVLVNAPPASEVGSAEEACRGLAWVHHPSTTIDATGCRIVHIECQNTGILAERWPAGLWLAGDRSRDTPQMVYCPAFSLGSRRPWVQILSPRFLASDSFHIEKVDSRPKGEEHDRKARRNPRGRCHMCTADVFVPYNDMTGNRDQEFENRCSQQPFRQPTNKGRWLG